MQRNLDKRYYVNSYDKEKDIYSNKEHTLLLVIDEQPKLMSTMENGEQTILNTLVLINAFKEYGMPIHATEQYPKGLGRSDERLLAEIDEDSIFAKSIFDLSLIHI